MQPFAREHDAGLHQFFVELAHLGQQLLVGQNAGFRVLRRLDQNHESHRHLSVWLYRKASVSLRPLSTIRALLRCRTANLEIDTAIRRDSVQP